MARGRAGAGDGSVAGVTADRMRPPTLIAGPSGHDEPPGHGHEVDPRAVWVGVAPSTRLEGDPAFSLAPPPDPGLSIGPGSARPGRAEPHSTGSADAGPGGAGSASTRPGGAPPGSTRSGENPLVNGVPTPVLLHRFDAVRARLELGGPGAESRTYVLLGPVRLDRERGTEVREVVVDGWRVEVEIEPERRAVLRERARHGAGAASKGGPVEVRAIIPGRIVAVSVKPGDDVEAGQQILVVEAMKMQNELRAPREGSVERVGVALGDTIEVGDLLVVIH
jgi:biotin carboxyl carrier protein